MRTTITSPPANKRLNPTPSGALARLRVPRAAMRSWGRAARVSRNSLDR